MNQTPFMEYKSERQMRDEQLKQLLENLTGKQDIREWPKGQQKIILREMLNRTNAGLRQLARVTGVSIGIIRYLEKKEG